MTYDSEVRKPTTIVILLSLFVLFARYAQTICFKWWQIVFKWKTLELDMCVNIHIHITAWLINFFSCFFILLFAHLFCFGYYYSHALYVLWVGINSFLLIGCGSYTMHIKNIRVYCKWQTENFWTNRYKFQSNVNHTDPDDGWYFCLRVKCLF